MADYAKVDVTFTYSEESDYNPADFRKEYGAYEVTPDEWRANKVEAATGGVLVLPDVDPSTDPTITADTAAVECRVFMCGS